MQSYGENAQTQGYVTICGNLTARVTPSKLFLEALSTGRPNEVTREQTPSGFTKRGWQLEVKRSGKKSSGAIFIAMAMAGAIAGAPWTWRLFLPLGAIAAVPLGRGLVLGKELAGSWRAFKTAFPLLFELALAVTRDAVGSLAQKEKPERSEVIDLSGYLEGCDTSYSPPRWARRALTQSLLALLRARRCDWTRFVVEPMALPDGGMAALCWAVGSETLPNDAPIAVMCHGLAGSHRVGYIRRFAAQALRLGFRPVVAERRGHGATAIRVPSQPIGQSLDDDLPSAADGAGRRDGADPSALRTWPRHADTMDLRSALSGIRLRYPQAKLVGIGFSAGGNLLLKHLGEDGAGTPLCAAASLANGYDVAAGEERLSREHKSLCAVLCALLKSMYRRNFDQLAKAHGDLVHSQHHRVMASRSIREFDSALTVPLYGYDSVDDYYRDMSSRPVLPFVRVPTLLLNAQDDPFVDSELLGHGIEAAKSNPNFTFVGTKRGGHMAWLDSENVSWADRFTLEFISRVLKRIDDPTASHGNDAHYDAAEPSAVAAAE